MSWAGPRIIGTPSARYAFNKTDDSPSRFLSIAAVFRTDRVLDRDDFATIAAAKLTTGQDLPRGLFSGTTPIRLGQASKHCYLGEVTQIARHTRLRNRDWKLGLRDDGRIVGPVKTITLKSETSAAADGGRWALIAAKRLGC